jgi:hypothetical protein
MADNWVKNLAGEKALIDVADSDRWSLHGWSEATEPGDRDFVWMASPEVGRPGLLPWGARDYWQGIGFRPSPPPEPVNPTRDPALTDAASGAAEVPPDGTVTQVAEWVGDDPVRARSALAAEERRDAPRTTLVDQLQRVGQNHANDGETVTPE